eukprot:CAMPEP_0169482052 /NCGR_PEP_ID=MMETSP1042-20121227/30466_1 /TAXON_ID=464988 /ORGANISM="Hemiselmis andersenii, Strain CCMP1180" /LENGTH=61 /DNA_ID=CAMNT_0009596887 /DNA_START=265 /DNA_END=447 /DNA_ORIENTATION=+
MAGSRCAGMRLTCLVLLSLVSETVPWAAPAQSVSLLHRHAAVCHGDGLSPGGSTGASYTPS